MIDPAHDTSDFYDEPAKTDLAHRARLLSWSMLDSVLSWWFSRRWWRILAGVPAVLMVALILLPSTFPGLVNSATLADRYKFKVHQALERNDLDSADLYLKKLMALNATDPATLFATAYVAQQRGDQEQADSILTKLSSGENSYPPAHLWMAKRMAADKSNWKGENRSALIGHLKAALKTDPPPIEANLLLGQIYTDGNEYAQAVPYFEAVVSQRPELHLSLGQIHLQLRDVTRANLELQQAAKYFQSRAKSAPNDPNVRLAWALAVRLQNDFSQAKAILIEGLRTEPNHPQMREVTASFCIDEFDQLAQLENMNFDKQLELLETAIAFSPNHPGALQRLAVLCSVKSEAGDRARAKLQEALVAGKATATIHLILGIQAVVNGDATKAALHFDQGQQLNPNMPVLLNNFAWLLANQREPELERALTLVNRALDTLPNEPNIRETRGQIYVKLERWREALADLEFALPHMTGSREVHASLSRAYQVLGDGEIAEKHRRLAEAQ